MMLNVMKYVSTDCFKSVQFREEKLLEVFFYFTNGATPQSNSRRSNIEGAEGFADATVERSFFAPRDKRRRVSEQNLT